MKILALTPINTRTVTPETGFAKLLEKHGHEVMIEYTGYNLSHHDITLDAIQFNPDVIWGMMEYSLPTAILYKKLLNKPVVAHIECIPPWRTKIDNPKDYGFDHEGEFDELTKDYKGIYNVILSAFLDADYRTISQDTWRYTFEKLLGKIDGTSRYYTYNTELLSKPDETIKQKNQIFSIARFTPIKRVHHVIEALSKIDKAIRPKYVVIGYGDEYDYLQHLADKLGVDVEFVGDGKDGVKERVIQESMFGVQIFSGMPVIEAAYYKKGCISYDTPQMVDLFNDSVAWCKMNDIDALAKTIEEHLYGGATELGVKANEHIFGGKTKVKTIDKYVEDVIKTFEIAIYRNHLYNNTDFIKDCVAEITPETKIDVEHDKIIYDQDCKGVVLDIGGCCGIVDLVMKLKKPELDITVLEMNKTYSSVNVGLIKKNKLDMKTYNGKLTVETFKENQFDTVVMTHVLEHVPNPEMILGIITKILKPGGHLFIVVPFENHHDSPEHLHYYSDGEHEIETQFNGNIMTVDFLKMVNNLPFTGSVEIINALNGESPETKPGGWLNLYAKLKNEKKA